jgi:GTP-binding protein Era
VSRCGLVALVGRPNVGKSTLMNHLVGEKVSITSRKPQTTRHRIHGILSRDDYQIVFADTPGINHEQTRALNRYMNEAAESALSDVDVICFMVDGRKWTPADEQVLELLPRSGIPVLLLVNKVDQEADKEQLLPHLEFLGQQFDFAEIMPVAALKGHNMERLESELARRLPEGEFWFDPEQPTDRSVRFMAAEIVREKVVRQLGQEVPHQVTVEIDLWQEDDKRLEIAATILVERKGQKKILVGSGGDRIKQIGIQARQDIERLLDRRIMLNLWVKVKGGWSDDERALHSLGYGGDR